MGSSVISLIIILVIVNLILIVFAILIVIVILIIIVIQYQVTSVCLRVSALYGQQRRPPFPWQPSWNVNQTVSLLYNAQLYHCTIVQCTLHIVQVTLHITQSGFYEKTLLCISHSQCKEYNTKPSDYTLHLGTN